MPRVLDKRGRIKRQWGMGTPYDVLHGNVPHNDFDWINQGGATAVQRSDRSVLLHAPAGTGDNWRIRQLTPPAAPYSIVLAFRIIVDPTIGAGEAPAVAAGWRDNGGNLLTLFRLYYDFDGGFLTLLADHSRWNSATSFNSVVAGPVYTDWLQQAERIWLKLVDDNTNLSFYLSPDGIDFGEVWSLEGRTSFLAQPNKILYAANADNANYFVRMQLATWRRES